MGLGVPVVIRVFFVVVVVFSSLRLFIFMGLGVPVVIRVGPNGDSPTYHPRYSAYLHIYAHMLYQDPKAPKATMKGMCNHDCDGCVGVRNA